MTTDQRDTAITREVRLAVVLFGGVSLAVYMNGIAQELLHLVRATAPEIGGGPGLHVSTPSPVESVYRELGRYLRNARYDPSGGDTSPVATRFVVDILTGTSAGGINGVYLAKALACDRSIDALSSLWVEQGDISLLLNDRHAYAGLPLTPEIPPQSLLAGRRMYFELLKAVDGVSTSGEVDGPSPYADAIDLWITATDLHGEVVALDTADMKTAGPIDEVNHRVTFHFVYARGRDDVPTGPVNQFTPPYDPMLAFAARCTSSFPAAFAPMQLGVAQAAWTSLGGVAKGWLPLDDPKIARFFKGASAAPNDYLLYSYADGGYLDNEPVGLVLNTLPKRRATQPVDRLVLFVDPDPGKDTLAPESTPSVDLVQTLVDVVTLPRDETIGGDIDRILALAPHQRGRREAYGAVDAHLAADIAAGRTPPPPGSPAPNGDDVLRLAAAGDQQVRASQTAADIAAILARVTYPNHVYDEDTAVHRALTRAVVELAVPVDAAALGPWLDRYDAGYLMARINFVEGRIGGVLREAEVFASAARFEALASIRTALDGVYLATAARIRALGAPLPGDASYTGAVNPAQTEIAALRVTIDGNAPDAPLPLGDAAFRAALVAVAERFVAVVDLPALTAAAHDIATGSSAIGNDAAWVRVWWDWYAAYRGATLAVSNLLPGENDTIRVLRVSPNDVTRIPPPPGAKLAGVGVHHFGAFFSADWRRNDMLWGRLDGAERLITAITLDDTSPPAIAWRDGLIDRAHVAIVSEALTDPGYHALLERQTGQSLPTDGANLDASARAVVTWLGTSFHLPPGPPPAEQARLAGRVARVARRVGDGLTDAHPGLTNPVGWAGRALAFTAWLAQVALWFRGLLRKVFRRS